MTSLSICVVNYNGQHYIRGCLDALAASSEPIAEIIVVDNASTDASPEIVERYFPDVTLIRLAQNAGPPVARNRGFAAARGERVLFVDNDVTVTPQTLGRLIAAADRFQAAVAMPRVCYDDRRDVIQYDGAGCHPVGLMTLKNRDRPVAEAEQSVRAMRSVVTACILVDRRRLNMARPFDESFFFNYEDHDFGLRCSVAGETIIGVPAALCYHGAGTQGLSHRANGAYAARRVYCLIRNRWLVLLKVYRPRTLLVLLPALVLYECFQLAGATARGWLGQWLASAWWVLAHVPEILRKRREVQSTRRIDDFDLFDEDRLPFSAGLARGPYERAAIVLLDRLVSGYCGLVRPSPPKPPASPR